MGSVRLQGRLWRSVVETIYWHISRKIRWNQGWSQYLREWGTKMSFFSLSDGFLPKSSITCSDFFQVGDQERGEEAWAVNCLLVVCPSQFLLKEGASWASPLNLSSESHPFPLLLGWRYTRASHTPKLVTDGRSGDGCLALVPFISNAVVMTNIYLPICIFRSWTPEHKKQMQQVESCLWFTCLFKFLGSLFCLI